MLSLKFNYGGLKPTVIVDCSREDFDVALFKKYFNLECERQGRLFEIREPESIALILENL